MIRKASTALRLLTVKGIPENDLSHTLVGFFTKRPGDAVIQHIPIEDTVLTMWPNHLIETYSTIVKHLELRNCQTHPLRWLSILKDICHSPTVKQVSIVDCKVVDCKLVGPGVPENTAKLLAPFDELGAKGWVGNAEIRKGLMQIGHQIIQRWAPPPAPAIQAAQVAHLPNPLVALPTPTQ
jgi:hypothetical protein